MRIVPRRGKSGQLNDGWLGPHELFYATDLKMLGVADENGNPQLLAETLIFDSLELLPEKGDPNKFYSVKGVLYHFNNGYRNVKLLDYNVGIPYEENKEGN
jgi:hypothetical protein